MSTRARDTADVVEDVNDALGSKLPYSFGTATPTTTDSGFLWYDSNSTPAAPKFWTGSAFQALTSGKVLQVVRATDSTLRTTTSTSFVDVTGMSVTITPQKSDSAVIIIAVYVPSILTPVNDTFARMTTTITDSSNNEISGGRGSVELIAAKIVDAGLTNRQHHSLFAYATPATTSAVTYKLRFQMQNAADTGSIHNNDSSGQMYAIEVSA